jgi:hypothetical protein
VPESLHGLIRKRFGEISDIALHYQSRAPSFFDLRSSGLKIMDTPGIQHDITTEIGKA